MSPIRLLSRVAEDRAPGDIPTSRPLFRQIPVDDASCDLGKSAIKDEVVRLYDRYAPALLRRALAICGDLEMAQDAVQEAFLRYYIALQKESSPKDARGWLYSTTRNYVLDRMKEYFVRNAQSLAAASGLAHEASNPDALIMVREIKATACDLLTPRELACLRLRNEGLRYREIANILKIESTTVGVFLGRALKKIRSALNRKDEGS